MFIISTVRARKQSDTFKWVEVPMLGADRKMQGGEDTALFCCLYPVLGDPLTLHTLFFQNITEYIAFKCQT